MICNRRSGADLDLGGAVALLIFFAFAMQCMSTVAVVRRETAGWRWPVAQFAYMTLLAYVSAFAGQPDHRPMISRTGALIQGRPESLATRR